MISWLKIAAFEEIKKRLPTAKTFQDYNEILQILEQALDFANVSQSFFFTVAYPTMLPQEDWGPQLIPQYHLSDTLFRKLVEGGFTLADKAIFDKSICNFLEVIFGDNEHILIDAGYGIVPYPHPRDSTKYENIGFDPTAAPKYCDAYPFLKNWGNYLSVGNCIAQHFEHGYFKDPINYMTYHVSDRHELDQVISTWSNRLASAPVLSLWFRGQNKEYLLPDLRSVATDFNHPICPWRHVRDAALTPSIYRITDIGKYTHKLCETLEYQIALGDHFSSCLVTSRQADETTHEKIPEHMFRFDFTSTTVNEKGEVVSVRDYHNQYAAYVELLFQQHYGLESPLLDITSNIDVALFFAQNRAEGNRYVPVKGGTDQPVIYLFLLNKELDPFIDSQQLMQDVNALRPIRQQCGILSGATTVSKEFYSRFIALKIVLDKPIAFDPKYTPDYLFPGPEEDQFLQKLMQVEADIGAEYVHPFVLG